MKNIEELLNRLLQVLTEVNAPLVNMLQKGIDRSAIEAEITELEISLPEEVYSLFNWRNGISLTGNNTFNQAWFFPLGSLTSLEDSTANYRFNAGNDGYWNEKMFMLFESGVGEMYLIDCDDKSPTYRMIYKHWAGAVDFEVVITMYDSLECFLRSVNECFETKAYYYDETGGFIFDFTKGVMVSKKNNPKSEMWKIYSSD
ncbi:MAG TPA: SMI1/KNR4 family protein [Niastella sp.]